MDKLKTTNRLLLLLAIPLIFYMLKTLSFIFIPLVFSIFTAMLFLPLMRRLKKIGIGQTLSVLVVIVIMIVSIILGFQLIKIASYEIMSVDAEFIETAEGKLIELVKFVDSVVGLDLTEDKSLRHQLLTKVGGLENVGPTLSFINNTLTTLLLTIFFTILWLAGSINIRRILNRVSLKSNFSPLNTIRKVEKDLIKFIKVKFVVSLFTGIGTGLVCYFFDVNFPIFWGVFAFLVNFVQLVGSIITVISASLFGFIDLQIGAGLFFYILSLTSVQVFFGTILEPIFMGKSFSINIITVLVMLMFWGYIWGIPGMIMSIPLTVFFKIVFEQFPKTEFIAEIIAGEPKRIPLPDLTNMDKKKE